MTLVLKRFTGFAYGAANPAPELWINPAQIAYVEPRIVRRGRDDEVCGTRVYFNVDGGVVDVRESIGHVVALLSSGSGSICRDCFAPLPDSWMSLCDQCRDARHQGVDNDWEAA